MTSHERLREVALPAALLGTLAITRFYGLGRYSMWSDESWVAASIAAPTIREMLVDFWHVQLTPPLFLLLARGLVAIFGDSDFAFRLVPALGGVGSLLLVYLLGKQLTKSTPAGLVAAALWGCSAVVLRYAQELKQYSTDAFASLLLLYLAERYLEQRARDRAGFPWLLTIASILAIGLAHTAVFVLPVVTLRLAWAAWRETRPSQPALARFLPTLVYAAVSLAAFLTNYLLLVAPQMSGEKSPAQAAAVRKFWARNFPESHAPDELFRFATARSYELFPYLFEERWGALFFGHAAGLALAACGLGLVLLALRRRGAALWCLLGPVAVGLVAAVAGLYPYGGERICLYLAPLLFIAIGFGLCEPLARWPRAQWSVTLGLVLLLPLHAIAAQGLSYTRPNEQVRPMMEHWNRAVEEGDFSAVYYSAWSGFVRYREVDRPLRAQRAGSYAQRGDQRDFRRQIDQRIDAMSGGRLWLLFATPWGNERAHMLAHVAKRCAIDERLQYRGASAFAFRCEDAASP